jgi:iron complex outermembrane receptor protein
MVQGDLFKTGRHDPNAYPALAPSVDREQGHSGYDGGYLQARWTRSTSADSESVFQFSYDRSNMNYPWLDADLHNLTLDFQKRTQTGETNEIYWGAGYQQYWDNTVSTRFTGFNPSSAVFRSGDVVLRDEWQVRPDRLLVSAGIRLDYNSYRDVEYQPSLRLLYTPRTNQSAWVGVSRAVRTPNRVDRDVVFDPGSETILGLPVSLINYGSKSMRSEVARTAEAGYRFQSGQRWSVDTSVFWSQYSRVRSVDYALPPEVLVSVSGISLRVPMLMANSGAGRSSGGETWATVQLRHGWRLIPSYSYLSDDRWLPVPSANYATLWEQIPADIRHQGAVRLQYDVARNLQLDLMARARSRDRAHELPGVLLADVRFSWHPVRSTEFAFTAHNLTDRGIFETVSEGTTPAIPIRRIFLVQWTQRF